MSKKLIKHATLISEDQSVEADLLIVNNRIERIDRDISMSSNAEIVDAQGLFLLPGLIDDQVHFREPGLTHKGTIETESRAAVAGGITSFMEMPNTFPQTTSRKALDEKLALASRSSYANYAFMIGATNDNLEELLRVDPLKTPGIKIFLGSSTGDMLVDDEKILRNIFSNTPLRISVHCEDETTIKSNLDLYGERYGDDIPISCHPIIRSSEACYISSSKAIALAKETGARLHVFHLSTNKETHLFESGIPLERKQITSEVCIHHLWFCDKDYNEKGSFIKWNPAIKTAEDREGLWQALLEDRIDVIATDHAPHTLVEKKQPYKACPSGGPLVQHGLVAMLEAIHQGRMDLKILVKKMCHSPAILFDIKERGYLREGYFADLVLVNMNSLWKVERDSLLYKCGWSPFEGTHFRSRIEKTYINGMLAYSNGSVNSNRFAAQLEFNR